MKIIIEQAKDVKVGDFVIVPVHNVNYDRDVHFMGEVSKFDFSQGIVEIEVKLAAHVDGKTGVEKYGMKPHRKIGIIRKN